MRPSLLRIVAITAAAVSVAATAAAQAPSAVVVDPITEVAPTSRAIVASASLLARGGFEEATIRSRAGQARRMSFRAAGSAYGLMSSADPIVPRRAFGEAGSGAAFLVRLPEVTAGVAPDDPVRAPHYALASVVGTRLSVWAFFSDVPSDGELSRRMIVAFGRLQRPLLMFDTAFQPGAGVGADRYTLK